MTLRDTKSSTSSQESEGSGLPRSGRDGREAFSPEVSPAKTYHYQDQAPDFQESALAYGVKWYEPFAWYDQDTRLWRTWQLCLDGEWAEFLGTWPKAGLMRNGIAYQRVSLSDIAENGHSLWPTLCARDYRSGATPDRSTAMARVSSRGNDLPAFLRLLFPERSGLIDPYWAETYLGYPEGHTELPPSATPSYPKSRSKS